MIKKIELELHFDDNFVPPERFEEPTRNNNWKSKCEPCPFYVWGDEYAHGDCVFLENAEQFGYGIHGCPIKKFFD